MSCFKCDAKFGSIGVLWQKKVCQECKLSFCSRCAPNCFNATTHSGNSHHVAQNARICLDCKTLNNPDSTRDELIQIKTKVLQAYLLKRDVSMDNCFDKDDLIELILSKRNPEFPQNYVSSTHRQEFFERLNNATETNESQSAQTSYSHQQNLHTGDNIQGSSNTNVSKVQSPDNIRIHLDQINELDEISNLSVRQLKYLLATNRVSFQGSREKQDLVDLTVQLWNQKQKDDSHKDNIEDSELCKICMVNSIDCVMLECGHMATCIDCAKPLSECPICRKYIVRVVKTFKC